MSSKRSRPQSKTKDELLSVDANGVATSTTRVCPPNPTPPREPLENSFEQDPKPTVAPNNTEIELAKKNLLVAILSKDVEAIPDVVDEVIKVAGSLNYREGKTQETLLHKCVSQKVSSAIVQILLDKGARLDARDGNMASPLHTASAIANVEMMEFLIEKHADPMKKDKNNQTALHKAARSGNIKAVEILLNNSVLINHKDFNGFSALHIAAEFEKISVVEYLIQRSADVVSTATDGQKPVDMLPKYFLDRKKPTKISFSPDGKKIYKMLKRKGGCKAAPTSSLISLGDGLRSHSIDHRHKSLPHEPTVEKKQEIEEIEFSDSEEEDKVALKCEESMAKISNAPRVDRLGFFIPEGVSSDIPVLSNKKIKKQSAMDQKRTLKWISWINDWDISFEKQQAKVCITGELDK